MTTPAQVSGPGSYSARTDSGGQPIRSLPDPSYGEATEFRDIQKSAPLADSASTGPKPPYPSDIAASAEPPLEPAPPLPGLFDQGDPGIPMTAGAPMGPGPNVVPGQFDPVTLRGALEPYFAADPTGVLAPLADYLSERGLW